MTNEPENRVSIPGFEQPEAARLTGGQPDRQQLTRAAQDGLRRVINLRPESEDHGFDEAALAEQVGLSYCRLPVSGPGDLTLENARRLDQLLSEAGDESTLVHCASGNRVGALMALRAAWIQGRPAAEALQTGRRWGLTKMEPAVVALLNG